MFLSIASGCSVTTRRGKGENQYIWGLVRGFRAWRGGGGSGPVMGARPGSVARGGGADGFQAENNKRSHFCNHVVPINTHCLLIKCLYDSPPDGQSLHTTGFSQRTKRRRKRLLPSFFFSTPPSPNPLFIRK